MQVLFPWIFFPTSRKRPRTSSFKQGQMFNSYWSLHVCKYKGRSWRDVISAITNMLKDTLTHIQRKELTTTKNKWEFLQHVTYLLCTNVSFCNYLGKQLFNWLQNRTVTWCCMCKAREIAWQISNFGSTFDAYFEMYLRTACLEITGWKSTLSLHIDSMAGL